VRSQGFGETLVVLSGVGAEVSYRGGFGGVSFCLVRLSAFGRKRPLVPPDFRLSERPLMAVS